MQSPSKKVFFTDLVFQVPANVYEPAEDTFLFAENLEVREGDVVVDVGTGCGILGVIAAKKAAEVLAIDVNPHAANCAKENARLNRVTDKMSFIQGDLFKSIRRDRKFDLIMFNAPYLPSENENGSWLGLAWSGGVKGRQVIDRFVCEAPAYQRPNGRIFLMQSSLSGVDETLQRFGEGGLEGRVVASRNLPFFETIVLIRAVRSKRST